MRSIALPASHRLLATAAGLLVALHSFSAAALAIAIRAPMIITNPASIEFDSRDMGLAQVNPSGVLLVLEPGYAVTTQASADDVSGILTGRAGFGLVVDRVGALPAAFAEANITGDGQLPGGPGVFYPVTITLALHGVFIGLDGTPAVNLRGTLSVWGVPDAPPTGQVTSAIDWIIPEGLPAVQTTTHAFIGNNPAAPYPGAQPIVVSSHPSALVGLARISFLAEGGSTLTVEADLQGQTRPLLSLGISREGDGQIDFLNTATLRVELPEGVELTNPTGALASGVIVPEPSGGLALALGIAFATVLVRRRGSA